MDIINKAYAFLPLFNPFNRGVKSKNIGVIKPEQILGPITFMIFLFGVCAFTFMLDVMFVEMCDTREVEFHKVFYLIEGMVFSISTILLISYLKWVFLSCESDSSMFAEMRSLSIIAIYPFLIGVIKYLDISSFTTIAFNQMYIHINPIEVFDFIVVAWLVIESVYAAKRWIECKAEKEQEDNLIEGIFTKEVCDDLRSPE